jgi:hypothetical protein
MDPHYPRHNRVVARRRGGRRHERDPASRMSIHYWWIDSVDAKVWPPYLSCGYSSADGLEPEVNGFP